MKSNLTLAEVYDINYTHQDKVNWFALNINCICSLKKYNFIRFIYYANF